MRKCARIRLEYFDDISYRSNVDLSSEKLPTQLKEMIMALVMICSSLITIIALGITISSVNVVVAALSIGQLHSSGICCQLGKKGRLSVSKGTF